MGVTTEVIPGECSPDNARKGSMGKIGSVKEPMAERAAVVNAVLRAQGETFEGYKNKQKALAHRHLSCNGKTSVPTLHHVP